MDITFKRSGEEDYPRQIRSLVTGYTKSGLTTFASTWPNVVFANIEANLMSIAHLDIPYVTIDSSDRLRHAAGVLRDEALRKKAAGKLGLDSIDSLAVDTVDGLQRLLVRERLVSEHRTQLERGDWGWLQEQMREIVRSIVTLPIHVCLTVHAKTTQDDAGRIILSPGLQGGSGDEIAGMVPFSLMTYRTVELDADSGQKYTKFWLQTEGDERHPYLGSLTGGRLMRTMEPRFDDVYAAVYTDVRLNRHEPVTLTVGEETPVQPMNQPSGVPPSDENKPVTTAALDHLERMLKEFDLVLPEQAKEMTLGKARSVARMVIVAKENTAEGKETPEQGKEELINYLKGMGLYQDPNNEVPKAASIADVMAWVDGDPEKAQRALDHEVKNKDRPRLKAQLQQVIAGPDEGPSPQQQGKQEAQPSDKPSSQEREELVQSVDQETDAPQEGRTEQEEREQAAQLVTQELGGKPVRDDAEPLPKTLTPETVTQHKEALMRLESIEDAPLCMETGNPINDLDIAKLALMRHGTWLSVPAYLKLMRSA